MLKSSWPGKIRYFIFSLLVVGLAFFGDPSYADTNPCNQALTTNKSIPIPFGLHHIEIDRQFSVGPFEFKPGLYRVQVNENDVVDIDGLVGHTSLRYPNLKSLFQAASIQLQSIDHWFYKSIRFKPEGFAFKSYALINLLVAEFKAKSSWYGLAFVPRDTTSLTEKVPQIKKGAKQLRRLHQALIVNRLPESFRQSNWTKLFEYFNDQYRPVILEIETLKIPSPTSQDETWFNDQLTTLSQLINKILEQLRQKGSDDPKEYDFQQLTDKDHDFFKTVRSKPRASLAELNVALIVPKLIGLNTTVRSLIAAKGLQIPTAILEELESKNLMDREFDVISKKGIYEVKTRIVHDFTNPENLIFFNQTTHSPAGVRTNKISANDNWTATQLRQTKHRNEVVRLLILAGVLDKDADSYIIETDGRLANEVFSANTLGMIQFDPNSRFGLK